MRRGCHILRTPGQVALKRLGSTAKEQQAATNRALENKAEVLSQVLPTSRELKFMGRTTCDREIRQLFSGCQITPVELTYSISSGVGTNAKALIVGGNYALRGIWGFGRRVISMGR